MRLFCVLSAFFLLAPAAVRTQPQRIPLCGTPRVNDPVVRQTAWNNALARYPEFFRKRSAHDLLRTAAVGEVDTFWVYNFVSGNFDLVPAELRATGSITDIWVSSEELQNQHIDSLTVDEILKALEMRTPSRSRDSTKGVVVLDMLYFGNPPNINPSFVKGAGDGKTDFLVCDIKDSWTPGAGGGYVAGFFFEVDVDPGSGFQGVSNRRDMLYIDSYPGIWFNGTRSIVEPLATLSHEFQHLIHWNYDPQEISFFNEGLSEYASYVCGYGLRSPAGYFGQPNVPLIGWSSTLEDYSRSALWTLYLSEQFGDTFVKNFTQNSSTGLTGFRNALVQSGINSTFSLTVQNFHIANILKNRTANLAYGFRDSLAVPGTPAVHKTLLGPTVDGLRNGLASLAADYIRFVAADTLHTTITQLTGSLAVKSIRIDDLGVSASDISPGVLFETTFEGSNVSELLLVVQNANTSGNASYSYTSTGAARTTSAYEVAYDDGVSQTSPNMNLVPGDTIFVRFDGIEGGVLDSVAMWFASVGTAQLLVRDYNTSYDFLASPFSGFGGRGRMPSPIGFAVTDTGFMKTVVDVRQFAISSSPDFVVEVIYNSAIDPSLRRDSSQSVLHSYLSLSIQPQSGRIIYQSLGDFYLRAYLSPAGSNPLSSIPKRFALLQNYPNPFNPSTVITYDLPQRSRVKLAVYDLLGREILVLKDEEEGPRRYAVPFDGSRLSAGVYFYRLTTATFTETKKMVLVR